MVKTELDFLSIAVAILTVSDSRGEEEDTAGHYLSDVVKAQGHQVIDKYIVQDNIYKIRAIVSEWIADEVAQCILITGGTGFTQQDNTPDALRPLFDREIEGFGELFRMLSFHDIGSATIQSRAIAGIANHKAIFAMPGSPRACQLAWEQIISQQLDARYRPCNFIPHLKKK